MLADIYAAVLTPRILTDTAYLATALKAIDPRIELLPTALKLPDDLTTEQWQAVGKLLPPLEAHA